MYHFQKVFNMDAAAEEYHGQTTMRGGVPDQLNGHWRSEYVYSRALDADANATRKIILRSNPSFCPPITPASVRAMHEYNANREDSDNDEARAEFVRYVVESGVEANHMVDYLNRKITKSALNKEIEKARKKQNADR